MILPASAETRHALGAEQLALLPAHAWVVNVGRGATVDEAAVLDAVRAHRLAGAALDVFEAEPLPAGSASGTSRTSSSPRTPPAAARSAPPC